MNSSAVVPSVLPRCGPEVNQTQKKKLRRHNLHNKRRYVYLFVCLLPMAGRTAGPIKTKLAIGTHVDPRSVLVKVNVKVIYLCVRYKEFMPATAGE